DDALATAKEMGARVVRGQTMGDSVGCALCLEPARGKFNRRAFEPIDYALRAARGLGIKVIPTIVGDDAQAGGTGCVYLRWRGREIGGDAFWALQAHADGQGWMPIPADTSDPQVARTGESGQWWAMYYTGVSTLVMSAADMAARAQAIRRHDYAMAGGRVPPH